VTKLEFIENVVDFFNESFDLPGHTDLKSLILHGFNTVHNAEFFRSVFPGLFIDDTVVSYQVALGSKTTRNRHVH
jgi:hypothetical protein